MNERTYRLRIWIPLAGFALFFGGLYGAWEPIDHLTSGVPLLVRNNKYTQATHPASQNELIAYCLVGLGVAVLGSLFILAYLNMAVVLDEVSIRIYGMAGRLKFEARFADIESVEERPDRFWQPSYRLSSRGQRAWLLNNYANWDEMIAAILGRSTRHFS